MISIRTWISREFRVKLLAVDIAPRWARHCAVRWGLGRCSRWDSRYELDGQWLLAIFTLRRVGLESSRNSDCDEKSRSHKGPSALPGDNGAFSWGGPLGVALQSGSSVQLGEGVLACARLWTMAPFVGGRGLVFTSGIQGAAWWAGGHGSQEGP